ncbi:MAG TPA: hypothetical protein VF823_05665 [Anaerolineales bacterium]
MKRVFQLFWAVILVGSASACGAAEVSKPIGTNPAPAQPTAAPAGASVPGTVTAQAQPTSSVELPLSTPFQPTAAPEILENRRLTLEWPATIRAGDGDVVRLTLEVDANGNLVPTAEIAGHETQSKTVQIPNLFDTHHVLAEARLDLAGVEVDPPGLLSQSLLPGQRVDFSWSVKPDGVGTFRGNVWFYLRFIPKDGGPETQRTISAQPIEIRSVDLLGLSGTPARLLGLVGTLLGSALGLDNLVSWVWKLVRRKKAG